MNRPSSTITAAAGGGLLAGVPLGTYLGGFLGGLVAYKWPGFYLVMSGSMDVEAALAGIITIIIATGFGYFKKETVLK